MQASIGSAQSTPMLPSMSASEAPPPSKRSKATKLRLFNEAMDAGCTPLEASMRAGINPSTACKWAKMRNADTSDIPSKDQLVVSLFNSYKEADTPYRANLAKRIVEMLGYQAQKNAVDSDRIATKPIRDLVIAWWAESNSPM